MFKNIITSIVTVAILALAFFPLFVAKNLPSYSQKLDASLANKPEVQFAKQFFSLVQTHNIDNIKKDVDPRLIDQNFNNSFSSFIAAVPTDMPDSVKIMGYNTFIGNGIKNTNVNLEYKFNKGVILANVFVAVKGDTLSVLGFHLDSKSRPLEEAYQFKFFGQTPVHYLVLVLALLILLFDLYVFVLCVKTPYLNLKWLWIIFILSGLGSVKFNWNEEQFYFFKSSAQVVSIELFHIPVAQLSQMLYQPFFVTMSLPLGAIIFFLKHKRIL